MNSQINRLEKQIRQLQIGLIICVTIIGVLVVSGFTTSSRKFDIIRAKGIVIEDDKGKDRILIGAPIPESPDRVRTNPELVRKYWAGKFNDPEQYMKWYSNYYHGAIGMVVMNEDGFDRALFGDKLNDSNTGKRIFDTAGILWNDPQGFERGGAGVNTSKDGKLSRAVIGLDGYNGAEAIHLVALEDGTNGLLINDHTGSLNIGMSKKGSNLFQNKEDFTGIKYFDKKNNLIWEQQFKK